MVQVQVCDISSRTVAVAIATFSEGAGSHVLLIESCSISGKMAGLKQKPSGQLSFITANWGLQKLGILIVSPDPSLPDLSSTASEGAGFGEGTPQMTESHAGGEQLLDKTGST